MTGHLIGIDAGSSLVKAVCFDPEGRELAVASRRTPLARPRPGWVEADPEACWTATRDVLREAVAGSERGPGDFGAIGITGAMVGAWLLDGALSPLRPGINWEDSRSQPLLERMIARQPDLRSTIFASSGSVLQQGCTLPLLAWLREEEPEILARAAHVVSYKDFLRARLTGTVAIDRSEAAVAPGDARAQGPSAAMRDLFGLGDLAPLFPATRGSTEIAGGLLPDIAAQIGLPPGLPVAVGAGDVVASVLGAGGLAPGMATAVLGTTCMLGRVSDAPVFDPPDLGLLFSMPDRHWFRAMVNVAGTLNLDWAMALLAPDLARAPDGFQRLDRMVAAVPVGANGVTYLPYLSESGIIAPVASARARAQFCGLHGGHGRAELLRAVQEGVALAIADLADALGLAPDATVTLTGGGSNSAGWCGMIANALGREVRVPEGSEFGARGAAMLAGVAIGHYPDARTASRILQSPGGRRHAPTGEDWGPVRARYRAYRDRLLREAP